MVQELLNTASQQNPATDLFDVQRVSERVQAFAGKAGRLLLHERFAMQSGSITYERCDDPVIEALRDELFSRSKSYGGLFKEILDDLDLLLFEALRRERK